MGREGPKRDGVGPALCIREGPEECERRLSVCKPTPMVLPLSAVDPKVAPCLRRLLNPASSPPPHNDKPFVGAPEGSLSALAGSLSLGCCSPGWEHSLASVQPSRHHPRLPRPPSSCQRTRGCTFSCQSFHKPRCCRLTANQSIFFF